MEKRQRSMVGIVSVVLALLNMAGVVFLAGFSVAIGRNCAAVFEGAEIGIPALTRAVIAIHWSVWLLAALLVIVLLALKETIQEKWIPLGLNILFIPMAAGYWLLFHLLVLAPLSRLVQHLGAG